MKECKSISVNIYMAGRIESAAELCRTYFEERGGCVTITPTRYVYTGGVEIGFIVGFINYPPYPVDDEDALIRKAKDLADELRQALRQQSYTIQGPTRTITEGRG